MGFSKVFQRRTHLFLMGLSALLLLSSGCRVWQRTKVSFASTIASRQFVQQAAESMEQNEVENASSQLALALKANPENIEARVMLADTLWEQGKHSEAIEQMEKVVLHPEVTAELVVKFAWMCFEQENYSLAQKYVSLGLKYNPELANAWILQGKISELQNEDLKALNAYYQAAHHAPEDGEIQILLARHYLKLGQPQRALEAAQAARNKIQDGTPSAEIFLCEGEAYSQLQRLPDALRVLHTAIALNPQNVQVLSSLASVQLQNQNYQAAYQTVAKGLELFPGNEACTQVMRQVQLAMKTQEKTHAGLASAGAGGPAAFSRTGESWGTWNGSTIPEPVRANVETRVGEEVQIQPPTLDRAGSDSGWRNPPPQTYQVPYPMRLNSPGSQNPSGSQNPPGSQNSPGVPSSGNGNSMPYLPGGASR